MNPNEFGLYMIILPHEARFCTIFGKIFKENEKSQPLWLTLNDLYFALNMDFQRKKPIFAYKTSYFQFGTLKYIDVVSAAEQRLGNFRSNVGNYQSAFNGLNVSVSRIAVGHNGSEYVFPRHLEQYPDACRRDQQTSCGQ